MGREYSIRFGGGLAFPYTLRADDMGFHTVLDMASAVEIPQGGLTTSANTIRDRPDEVKRMIRSLMQSTQALLRSKEKSIELLTRVAKVDQKTAVRSYDVIEGVMQSEDDVPTRAPMENILKGLKMQGRITTSAVPFEELMEANLAAEVARELGTTAK